MKKHTIWADNGERLLLSTVVTRQLAGYLVDVDSIHITSDLLISNINALETAQPSWASKNHKHSA